METRTLSRETKRNSLSLNSIQKRVKECFGQSAAVQNKEMRKLKIKMGKRKHRFLEEMRVVTTILMIK